MHDVFFQGAEAARTNPDVWWWLKANGCDITKGLKESVKLQWSGDVDLNDGALQEQCEANATYSEKLQSSRYNDKDLIKLSWKIKELGDLNEMGRKLHSNIDVLSTKIGENHSSWLQDNIPSQLKDIHNNLVTFIRGVTHHQRTAATHILVFMISNEEWRKKPYMIPVQCLPYKGLSDSKVQEFSNKIIVDMNKRKMKVAGEY